MHARFISWRYDSSYTDRVYTLYHFCKKNSLITKISRKISSYRISLQKKLPRFAWTFLEIFEIFIIHEKQKRGIQFMREEARMSIFI